MTAPRALYGLQGEEFANIVTHGVGLLLSVAGVALLLTEVGSRGNVWQISGCSVYAATLLSMYAVSTLYHGSKKQPMKSTLRTADHICIYLFIAGTYTPFTLVHLRQNWGWLLLVAIWIFAASGTVFKLRLRHRCAEFVSVATYFFMGWICLVAIKPMLESVPAGALYLLLAGGLFYTAGVYFYMRDVNRYFHAIWHLFVLCGSGCHYLAIFYYVVPPAVA